MTGIKHSFNPHEEKINYRSVFLLQHEVCQKCALFSSCPDKSSKNWYFNIFFFSKPTALIETRSRSRNFGVGLSIFYRLKKMFGPSEDEAPPRCFSKYNFLLLKVIFGTFPSKYENTQCGPKLVSESPVGLLRLLKRVFGAWKLVAKLQFLK